MNIVFAGDCGVDNYSDQKIIKPGGISLNGAVHFSKLRSEDQVITVVGALGDDTNAELVRNILTTFSINNELEVISGSTPVQCISNTSAGEKIFTKYEEGVLKNFTVTKNQITLINQSDILISPLFSQIEPFFKSVMAIPGKGLTCVDFLDLSDFEKHESVVNKYINALDIAFFGLSINDKQLINSLKSIAYKKNKLFVITLGSAGSIAFFDNRTYTAKPKKITRIIDTTGAGDAFAAAFLNEYLKSKDIQKSLNRGTMFASTVIQHVGGF